MSPATPVESEATLLICSEKPAEIARKIARLTSLAGYRIQTNSPLLLRDLYFDTPNRALQAQEFALRLRGINQKWWIALKGKSEPLDWGGVQRLEIEARWSRRSWKMAVRELERRNIALQGQLARRADPIDALTSRGLRVVQRRETRRRVRKLMARRGTRVLAELAIDTVTFHFEPRVRLYEMEFEAKAQDAPAALKMVMDDLLNRYGSALRRWEHGKLATGKAIEAMLRDGSLRGMLDAQNNLRLEAYHRIDDYLKRRAESDPGAV
jgi:inorganic triphosphatase YgiF